MSVFARYKSQKSIKRNSSTCENCELRVKKFRLLGIGSVMFRYYASIVLIYIVLYSLKPFFFKTTMYSGKQKDVIDNIYFYYKLLCSRTESFINEHPEAVEILTSYFEATGFRPMKPVQQTSIITGVSERSIRRFDEQQTFRDSLEPQKHLTGRRSMVLPDWCLESIRSIVLFKFLVLFYCTKYWHIFGERL